jgi:hypothetical protein
VFTARYALSPYIKQIRFVFKVLIALADSKIIYAWKTQIFLTRPERSLDPPRILYSAYWVSLLAEKRSARDVDHPPPATAGVKGRVELYLYSSSRSSWPGVGRSLACTFEIKISALNAP